LGNIEFARWAISSNAKRGQVIKLTYSFTGPWRIIARLHGALYKIKHCLTKAKEKKHASDLSPYPIDLIPFQPIDSVDNQYGQHNWKIKEHPYKEAGIKGFTPPTPFVVPTQFLKTNDALSFTWSPNETTSFIPNLGWLMTTISHDSGNLLALTPGF
jgi:hypothetical protein